MKTKNKKTIRAFKQVNQLKQIYKMKKIVLFFILCLPGLNGFSQNFISGKIIDSKTQEAIENVYVQNRNIKENAMLSQEDGSFSIEGDSLNTVDLHRIGYLSTSFVYDGSQDIVVEMEQSDYQLQEVVISFEEANDLVKKAFFNLMVNYSKHAPINYLWHGSLSELNLGAKRESYAVYSAKTNKVNFKKREISFNLGLIDLNHVVETNVQKSNIVAKSRFSTEYHPKITDWLTDGRGHKIVKQNTENDSLIFVQYVPRPLKGEMIPPVEIVINKSDTVLLSFKIFPLDSYSKDSTEKYDKAKVLFRSFFEYKLLTFSTNLFIKNDNGAYYIDSYESKTLISFLIDGKEELISQENRTKAIWQPMIKAPKRQVKLNGKSGQLFKLKGTTTNNFWDEN